MKSTASWLGLVSFLGEQEYFRDTCGGELKWLHEMSSSTFFEEGWALYAENPLISEDTDTYEDEPLQKYGMLQWQVRTRALSWQKYSTPPF